MPNSLEFSAGDARKIVEGKNPNFIIIEDEWQNQEKGVNFFSAVVQNKDTEKYYRTNYRCGYKPSLRSMIWPYERDDPVFHEVQLKTVTIKKWVEV